MDRLVLEGAAPVFTNLWLADALPRVLDPRPPALLNSDGDEVAFHTVRYALRPGTTADMVRARLRTVEALQEASESFWNWVEVPGAAAEARGARGRPGTKAVTGTRRTHSVTLDDGAVVLGNVGLTGDAVSLSANSRARAERGRALLTPLLGTLVGAPLTEVQTVEQVRASRPDREPEPPPADEIPPEVQASVVHAAMDSHYRAVLDQPLGVLGGKTPRACARTRAGRERVAGWLKLLEGQSRRGRDADDPMGPTTSAGCGPSSASPTCGGDGAPARTADVAPGDGREAARRLGTAPRRNGTQAPRQAQPPAIRRMPTGGRLARSLAEPSGRSPP